MAGLCLLMAILTCVVWRGFGSADSSTDSFPRVIVSKGGSFVLGSVTLITVLVIVERGLTHYPLDL